VTVAADLARCGPWLQAALDHGGTHTMADVLGEVATGKSLFWAGKDCAAVTEINRDLHVWLAGGDLRELLLMADDAARWAKANGFDRMTLNGRPGWERALRAQGYRVLPRTLVRDL
jgi:hypothetical protein